MKRRLQFSLRFLLVGITVCAVLSLLWRNRPPRELRVQLTNRGTAIVHDQEVALASLSAVLEREGIVRKLWLMQPRMILRAEQTASLEEVMQTIELGQRAGFERFTFAAP